MNANSPSVLQSIVETIIQTAHPEQVILFGSRAKGTAREESDYDFLVTVRGITNERLISRHIYRALLNKRIGVAVDVVVVSTETLQRCQNKPFFIYRQALEEGKILHDRMARI